VISFLVDQNFNEHIVDGLTRRAATLVFTHVRDVGLAQAPDQTVLEWAATHGRVLLTHAIARAHRGLSSSRALPYNSLRCSKRL
jgi:predicted nuclease of predicted toxin-antitoxin system